MPRRSAINWVRRLNQHYGLNIHLRMPNTDAKASADIDGISAVSACSKTGICQRRKGYARDTRRNSQEIHWAEGIR